MTYTEAERRSYAKRHDRQSAALDETRRVMAIMARDAHDEGIPETKIAKDLGVDRMTVRKWLGKRQ